MNDLLNRLVKKNIPETKLGTVASYIPELDKAKKDALGIYIIYNEGNESFSGDYVQEIMKQNLQYKVYLK